MKKIILFLTVIVALASCKRNFEEINTDPNRPTEVPATNVLLSSITSGLDRIHGASMNMTYAGLWAQQYAKIQYIDEDKYAYRPAAIDAHWIGLYAGPLFDLQDIINNGAETPNMRSAAMVMKAYYLSVITDVWGMVPFSEALEGDTQLTPNYDNQEDVMNGCLAMLDEAANTFDASADDLGTGDVIYNGDVTKWEKLANSLCVRILMRKSDRVPGAIQEAINILNSKPVFTDNADNAMLNFVGDNSYPNPIYENKYITGRDDHSVSERLVDMMNAGGFSTVMDPRLPVYAELNNAGVYVGQPNGSVEPTDFGAISRIGAAFRDDATAPVAMMTYSELLFLAAEANQDQVTYIDAIAASHAQHGASADATYLADANTAWTTNWEQALGEQKWIALFGNGVEAFSEVRRLDYPVLTEAPESVYPGQGVPVRFPYATTENSTNGDNLSAASSAQGLGASGLFAKVWWDMN